MIKIKAKIQLYKDVRTTPIGSGYRPLFNFIIDMKVSGQITLSNKEELMYPGEENVVEILFVTEDYFGNNLKPGGKFTFGEGKRDTGEGEVIEIL